jgi:cytidylate kinase
MPVIALTQGMGSLAQDIAEQLAAELNLSTLQHELAERVAEKMHVSKSLINRLRGGKAGAIERLRADRQAMALYTAEEVLEAAAKGNVVVRGWGSTQILRPVPHIPCIRVMRPFEQRVQWLMKQLDTDDKDLAEAEIKRSDHANASRMHDQFGVQWNEPVLFDMVLNTDRLSVETCVQQIKVLLARPEFAETPQSRALLQGMALSARVRAALRANEATDGVDITIDCLDGQATLRGIVADNNEKAAALQVCAGVAGVTSVDDQLRVMSRPTFFPSNRQ